MPARDVRWVGRSPLRNSWKPIAAAGIAVFLAIAAPRGAGEFRKFIMDTPNPFKSPKAMLAERLGERYSEKQFRIRAGRHVCTVDCGKRGSFTEGLENRNVLEADFSKEGAYRKEFYLPDRGLPLVMEGVGDDRDRYFIRYYSEGEGIVRTKVQHARNRGEGWKPGEEFSGEDAREIWADALGRFSPNR